MVFRWFKQDKNKEYQGVETKSDRVDRKTSGFQIPMYTLRIDANVPADVFIDGEYRGTTVEVIEGKHKIELTRGSKTIEKVIDVRRDETLNFNLELLKNGLLWSYEDYVQDLPSILLRTIMVAISSDGGYVVAGTGGCCRLEHGGVVYFFDRNGKLLWSYETDSDVESVAISSDGEYVVAGRWGEVYFFDRSGKLLWSYKTDNGVESVAMSSDGRYVVAGSMKEKDLFEHLFSIYFFCPIVREIEQTIRSNPSVKIPEEVLRAVKEFKSGNYDVDLKKAKEILDITLEDYRRAVPLIEEFRKKYEKCGIKVSEVRKPIELFEKGKYEECLKELERTSKILDMAIRLSNRLDKIVKGTEKLRDYISVDGILSKIEEIERCNDLDKISKLMERLESLVDLIENLIELCQSHENDG